MTAVEETPYEWFEVCAAPGEQHGGARGEQEGAKMARTVRAESSKVVWKK